MGGAERNARRKRQQQLATSKAAPAGRTAGGGGRLSNGVDRKVVIGVVVAVLLVGAVIAGVLITQNRKNATEGQVIPASTTSGTTADYPIARDGAVVVAGADTAKVTIDIYEDFLCPFCGQLEQTSGPELAEHVKAGELRIRYHPLSLLNEQSDPPGYSLDSANAALCAADAGGFPAFHASLFNAQPAEGSRGYDKGQLTRLGTDLGITAPEFASCVESGKYDQQVEQHLEQVRDTPHLQQPFPNGDKGFGTPTVASGEQLVDTQDPDWLTKLLAATG